MKRLLLALFVMAIGITLSGRAYAATTPGTMDVSVNMIASCTVGTTPVAFPDTITGNGAVATGDVTVNCSLGTPYNIALDYGSNYGLDSRYTGYSTVSDGAGNYVAYMLNKPDGTTWGDLDYDNTSSSGSSLADTGDSTDQAHAVHGSTPTFTVPGAYSDVVNVTVYY